MSYRRLASLTLASTCLATLSIAQGSIADRYNKQEFDIAMRDGVKLHTVVYIPKNAIGGSPIIMERTPYSAGPYGEGRYGRFLGSPKFQEKGYIFAFQDVRGKYLSEGDYENIRPLLGRGAKGTDETTDTYDTVDWLVKNVPGNNGSVGLWGISYPGFYAGAGAVRNHPALKAVSPQAPVSEWYKGDDVHHNGAFFIQDNFNFSLFFDIPRTGGPSANPRGISVDREGKSAYQFFLDGVNSLGLETRYIKGQMPYWVELMDHPNFDAYWKARSLPEHFRDVKCAVLTVGGWFDAEDLYGALNLYQSAERQNPGTPNFLVMGPWYHGMWAGGNGKTFGDLDFGIDTSQWYRENVEFPFFERYLRGQNIDTPAEATMFETGSNVWRKFAQWPPKGLAKETIFLADGKTLSLTKPKSDGKASYVNDPAQPTPYLADWETSRNRTRTYMIDDQRWAAKRDDVLVYQGEVLAEDLRVAGPIDVDLWASTTGTDADFVVKVIDVWPDNLEGKVANGDPKAGYQQNLRADIFRGRFRNSFEKPEPFVPGKPTRVHFKLNDVLHTFQKGHRLMIQVQSSWFPLVDRNPNAFVDTYRAPASAYQKATITLHHGGKYPSSVTFGKLD